MHAHGEIMFRMKYNIRQLGDNSINQITTGLKMKPSQISLLQYENYSLM